MLLLFALGVEFSIRELRAVGRVALPGGIAQIALIVAAGMALMVGLGSGWGGAFVVGACLSISSTLVVLKSLIDSGEIDSLHGRAAIGWSIVQDIATIVFIVALPSLTGGDALLPLAFALLKAAIFLALAYVLGTRLLPWLFGYVARSGSSELFLLVGLRHRAADGVRVERDLRPVARARGVRRRGRRLRVGPVAPGGGRGHAVPGPVRRPVLRLGGHAGGPDGPRGGRSR